VHQLFTDIKKAYDSVRREVIYIIIIIIIEYGIPMKQVRLIKMCLSRVRVGKEYVRHVSHYEWFETSR